MAKCRPNVTRYKRIVLMTRACLLSPLADPATDIDAEERANVAVILEALHGSGLEKVVAIDLRCASQREDRRHDCPSLLRGRSARRRSPPR